MGVVIAQVFGRCSFVNHVLVLVVHAKLGGSYSCASVLGDVECKPFRISALTSHMGAVGVVEDVFRCSIHVGAAVVLLQVVWEGGVVRRRLVVTKGLEQSLFRDVRWWYVVEVDIFGYSEGSMRGQ